MSGSGQTAPSNRIASLIVWSLIKSVLNTAHGDILRMEREVSSTVVVCVLR